jgi:dihydroorotase
MARSVGEIVRAKKEGLRITCEVTPHHLLLTNDANDLYGIDAKVNPPLRSLDDVKVVRKALKDGVIDMIASDHAPHGVKTGDWEKAAFGIMGLETTLGLVLTKLVTPGILGLNDAIAKLTSNPAAVFGLNVGHLREGRQADITIIDLEKKWKVDVSKFKSKSRNTPFHGWHLKGKAVTTIVKGKVVYSE